MSVTIAAAARMMMTAPLISRYGSRLGFTYRMNEPSSVVLRTATPSRKSTRFCVSRLTSASPGSTDR
jgi:hypothetical protein